MVSPADRPLVTERDIAALLASKGPLRLPDGALLTPAARDALRRQGLDPDRVVPRGSAARRLVIANWKSHKTLAEALAWASELRGALGAASSPGRGAGVVVCPPFTALVALGPPLAGLAELGAQDLSAHGEGAHTGEVAARHLADVGCRFALVGHSERRAAGETDALVRRKLRAALAGGLSPVLCVGETHDERRGGRTQPVTSEQLGLALEGLLPDEAARVVVAYEPRWAIGAGVTPTSSEVIDVLAHVRAVVGRLLGDAAGERMPVLYGGSVTDKNAAELLGLPGCSGALVGGASLKAPTFAAICRAC